MLSGGRKGTRELRDWINIEDYKKKKRNLAECSNWREETLVSIVRILERLKEKINKKLISGFQPGRSCTDATFALKQIIALSKEFQQKPAVHFVDFDKAFDSVNSEALS